MSKGKGHGRKPIKNVTALVMFSAGVGVVIAIVLPGISSVIGVGLLLIGGYVLFS